MKSFMLITGLLFSAVVNSAFGAELADADSQSDLAEMLRQQSEVISSQTQERASSIAIPMETSAETAAANNLAADSGAISAAAITEARELSRALLLAALETLLLR
jgi:hypothetical protein